MLGRIRRPPREMRRAALILAPGQTVDHRWDELFRAHSDALRKAARRMAYNHNDAEDLVHETIERYYKRVILRNRKTNVIDERAFVERNAIALLSGVNEGADLASETWLGRWAQAPAIRQSALWNVRHVDDRVDPEFLGVFERLVRAH